MLDFSILNSTQGNLAYEPFCLDDNNAHIYKQTHTYTDQLLDSSLYFNGYNNGNILHNVGCQEIGKGDATLDDLDVDGFSSNNWSLEDFLLGGNTDQVTCIPNAAGSHGSRMAASPASQATLSSSGSLDNLLDDLEITSPYGSPTSSGMSYGSPTSSGMSYGSPTSNGIPYGSPTSRGVPYGSPTSITSPYGSPSSVTSSYGSPPSSGSSALSSPYGSPTSSVNSSPFHDFMCDFSTPFASAVSASPLHDLEFVDNMEEVQSNSMDTQAIVVTEEIVDMSLGYTVPISKPISIPNTQATVIEATTPNSLNEISFVEMLSPNSMDSGISSSDEDLILNNWKNGQLSENAGLLELLTYSSPVEKVSDFTVIGEAASNLTVSSSPAETGSVKGTQRFAPYKGKGKHRTEEQKLRKKEHNRKSACKYRSKKKDECTTKSGVLEQLEERNVKLKTNVEDLRKEIDYLKSLLLDVIKAGVSKKNNAGLESLLAAGLTN